MAGATEVLGIPVSARDLSRWREWFAPVVQPFRLDLLSPDVQSALPDRSVDPTDEWLDTFFMYAGTWTWMNEAESLALRPSHRRALLAVRRKTLRPKLMPMWPSELARTGDGLMLDRIASGLVRPSRHGAVPARVWDQALPLLPRARPLAGTFAASGSGPNCFGTVTAAFGEPGVAERQIDPQQFQVWPEQHTRPVHGTASDGDPGTVFVWTENGELAHATVTLGSGWMLTKPSQSRSSARLVYTVREAVNSWRFPGTRLHRYQSRR